jgi:hypothetical protein
MKTNNLAIAIPTIIIMSIVVVAWRLSHVRSEKDPSSSELPGAHKIERQRPSLEETPINVEVAYEKYKKTLSLNDLVAAFRRNRVVASEYLMSIATGEAKESALKLLGRCLAQSSKGYDWDYLVLILKGSDLDIAQQGFFRGVLEIGEWDRAIEIIKSINNPRLRDLFRKTYLFMLSDSDSKKALYDMLDWHNTSIDGFQLDDKILSKTIGRVIKTSNDVQLNEILVSAEFLELILQS